MVFNFLNLTSYTVTSYSVIFRGLTTITKTSGATISGNTMSLSLSSGELSSLGARSLVQITINQYLKVSAFPMYIKGNDVYFEKSANYASSLELSKNVANDLLIDDGLTKCFSRQPIWNYDVTDRYGGYILITINRPTSWMLSFEVVSYQYYQTFHFRVSGYNYGPQYWYSPKAFRICGDREAENVYFGYTSEYNLWVAFYKSYYSGIGIFNVINGYSPAGIDQEDLFTITRVDSLPGTIQTTISI